ncbi:DCC1-like thiol-disulfide oxidoreductase family protein [Melghirimyces algeriensis]|uniref:Predicted thiol-disulfide oxidoreductase YuxK, DCC family n=1 Tax=Melghirimyces algeriensis TaxID=910412 RepID=A0A521DZK9_9BACL|nr:DCC1-like thiol-disulfide oxidoreductase family protein [Melghirimyces algeriensis]SMO77144.1 Predicted thiol-disulfide oxidoreductase YuxK, DCC family [Melghirimyces algeriensis]
MLKMLKEVNKKKQMLMGASILRISFGLLILYFYLIHYSQRYFLWGPQGMIQHKDFLTELSLSSKISLYQFSDSVAYFDVIFHLGILAALLFTLGFKGRIISIINFIFTWSIFSRNGVILDGGDNIMRILLLYLCVADTTAYFSIDSYLKKKKGPTFDPGTKASAVKYRYYLHNLAILACIVQVSMVYLTSGLHKAMGELWQKGTALYYILQVGEYTHPFFRDLIHGFEIAMVLGAYFTVLVQVSFPFLLFNRRTKYVAMAGVISMHVGIAIVMGLISFSATMISIQLLLLTDGEYRMLNSMLRTWRSRIQALIGKKRESSVPPQATAIVLYDSWCPLCTGSINNIKKLDWFGVMDVASFRDEEVLSKYHISPEDAEKRMHMVLLKKGKTVNGIHSLIEIAKRAPILWWGVPVMYLGVWLGLGQRIYDFFASRRTIIPQGQCQGNVCRIEQK